MADVTAHSSCSSSPTLGTLERNSTPNPPELQTNSSTLPDDVLHLQGEMNNAMVHLLTFRASVDSHQQRLISESETAHCQNETEALEAITGVEACYMVAHHNTKAVYAAAMREAEATHLASTRGRGHPCHHGEGSRSHQGSTNLQAMTNPPGHNASSGRQGPLRGKVLSLILPVGLWGGSSGLSQQSPRDTHVPHTFTNKQHVPHQPSNSSFTAAYQFKGSHLLSFLPQEACHHHASYW